MSKFLCLIYWSVQLMMPDRLSRHAYTKNILRDAKSIHNILKDYMYTENIIREYLNLLSLYQYISKCFDWLDAMTIYCLLFHLLNTVLNLLNIHIYMFNILLGLIILSIILIVYSGFYIHFPCKAAFSQGVAHYSVIFAFVEMPLSEQDVVSLPLTSSRKWKVHDHSHSESNVFDILSASISCSTHLL